MAADMDKTAIRESSTLGSDLIHEFACFSCEEADLNTEAKFLCEDCSKCYCTSCVIHHNNLFRTHKVLGQKDVEKWVGQKNMEEKSLEDGNKLEKCDLHPNKVIEMVCADHRKLCCTLCVSLNHRLCHTITLVEDLARGVHQVADFKQLPDAVNKVLDGVNQTRKALKKNQDSLQASGKAILTKIKELRKTLNQLLDELEKRTVEQMDSVLADLDETLQKDIDSCTNIHDQLKTMLGDIQGKNKEHESSSYIGFRKCQDMMAEANGLLKGISTKPEEVIFRADKHLQELLSTNLKLAEVKRYQKFDANKVFKTQATTHYNIKDQGDKNKCSIIGICELPCGDIIIADWKNSNVKLLNDQYKVRVVCDVPRNPVDICHTKGNELAIAVSCNDKKRQEVHFLKVLAGSVELFGKFSVRHPCTSIAYNQGQVYVGSGNALYLYTTDGLLINKIYEDLSSRCTVNHFALSRDGRKMYIPASSHNTLITIGYTGIDLDSPQKNTTDTIEKSNNTSDKVKLLATFKDPDLHWPYAAYVNDSGHLFVSAFDSHTVVQCDQLGKQKLATLLRKEGGINRPQAIMYSKHADKLIVGGDQNEIAVLELK